MSYHSVPRRTVLQALVAAGGTGLLPSEARGLSGGEPSITDPHTRVTFRAIVDAVVPRTPTLRTLGEEHVPGGLTAEVDDYLFTFVNSFVSFGLPKLGGLGTLRLAELITAVLDLGATKLIALGGNEQPPTLSRALGLLDLDGLLTDPIEALSEGPFAKLSRQDRLRAIHVLDEAEFDTADLPGPLVEGDAGLLAQLVVGYTGVGYYSEWQGYTNFTAPPGERGFTNDPSTVQSWRQSGFPGVANGYVALRGYLGTPDSSLGSGETWKAIDGGDRSLALTFESGQFRENEYDTDGYEEIYPEAHDDADRNADEVTN